MNAEILQRAAKYKTFAAFRRANPDDYAKLLKRGQARELLQMYENGEIASLGEPKLDKRLKENRVTPRITRAQIDKYAKYYTSLAAFKRNGGVYAEAAERLNHYGVLEQFFTRRLHTDEIIDEAEKFPDWETFEIDRPRYAADAVKQRLKDFIIQHLAKVQAQKGTRV